MLSRRDIFCLLATLIVLTGAAVNRYRLGPPPDAQPYMDRVRAIATRVVGETQSMIVRPGTLPRQAFESLRPNVLESREYTDVARGWRFSVLLVHCGDINDMGAHYPPACYPGQGLKVVDTQAMPMDLAGRSLAGVEYTLQPSRIDERQPLCIWNCMFLPGGTTTHEPPVLRMRGRTGNLRYYGAGQIQVLVPANTPQSVRLAIYQEALSIYQPVIEAMLSDPQAAGEQSAHE